METEQLFRIRIATDEQALEKFGKLMRETLGTQKENIKLLGTKERIERCAQPNFRIG